MSSPDLIRSGPARDLRLALGRYGPKRVLSTQVAPDMPITIIRAHAHSGSLGSQRLNGGDSLSARAERAWRHDSAHF